MVKLIEFARGSLEFLAKEEGGIEVGRGPTTSVAPDASPSVPAEDPERSAPGRPSREIIRDAISVLEDGLRLDEGRLSSTDGDEVTAVVQYLRKAVQGGDTPISVKGILKDPAGRTLVLRDAYSDYWDLPGGHVQEGEPLENALRREIKEETGLQVGLCNQTDTRMLKLNGDPRPVLFYNVEYVGGQPRCSEEHLGYQWAAMQELSRLNLGVFKDVLIPGPDNRETLEQGDPRVYRSQGPEQIPGYQVKDGGDGIGGAGDTMVGEDVHTPTGGGGRRRLKTLISAQEWMEHVEKISTGGGQFVTSEETETASPVEHRAQGSLSQSGVKVVKALPSNRWLVDHDLKVLSKAMNGKPFVVAGYASPVVVDLEGHRVSHQALAEDVPRFMAYEGRYANVNVFHCLSPETKVLVKRGGPGEGKTFKRIDEIGMGDRVFTHRGRKREVRHVAKFWKHEPIVRLELSNGEVVRITDDHQVLTTTGWMEAGKLTREHVLMHSRPRIPHSEETKVKISEGNKFPRPYAIEHMRRVGMSGLGAQVTADQRRGKTWTEAYGEEAAQGSFREAFCLEG